MKCWCNGNESFMMNDAASHLRRLIQLEDYTVLFVFLYNDAIIRNYIVEQTISVNRFFFPYLKYLMVRKKKTFQELRNI